LALQIALHSFKNYDRSSAAFALKTCKNEGSLFSRMKD